MLKIIQLGNVRIAARRIQLSDIEKLLRKAMAMELFFVKIAEKGYFLDRADLRQIKNMGENIPEDISFTD